MPKLWAYGPVREGRLRPRSRTTSVKHRGRAGAVWQGLRYKFWLTRYGYLVSCRGERFPMGPQYSLVAFDDVVGRTGDIYFEDIVMALKPLTGAGAPRGGSPAAQDPSLAVDHPLLLEHLTATAWEGGKLRKTSSLTVFADRGLWKCFLNERNSDQSLCVTGESILALLDVLEAALEQPDADWRASNRQQESGRRR